MPHAVHRELLGQTRRGPGRPAVVVTRRLPAPVESRLSELFDARLNPADRRMSRKKVAEALCSADGLLVSVSERLDAELLGTEGLRARILANFGVGYDHIDVDAARARGIVVTNTPGVLTDDTADLAIALMLAVARRLGEGERLVRAGRWRGWGPTEMLGTRVSGATLGIVGMGRIGLAVARRARDGLGMRVLFHGGGRDPEVRSLGAERRERLGDLLAESDFVSLHVPSTSRTRHLIDEAALARMRPTAFLVNTSRGEVVDERALVEALRDGRIAGAGLDVYEREPDVPEALRAMEHVVLLPHLGSATTATRTAMGQRAVDNLEAFFRGEEPPDRVA
jgi:lactate dehydrogenase-like 2-hydroxyacid dehydrogenase